MQLVTGCNAGYLPRMLLYLDSLHLYADFPVNFIRVGFEPPYLQGATRSIFLDGALNAGANKANWLHIGGRLGAYRYWDMNQAIGAAMAKVERLLEGEAA